MLAVRDQRFDFALTVVFVVGGAAEAAIASDQSVVAALLAAIAGASLWWRRDHPAVTALTAAAAFVAGASTDIDFDELFAPFGVVMIAMLSLGLHATSRELLVGLGGAATLMAASTWIDGKPFDALYVWTLLALGVVPARLLRRRLQEVARLTEANLRAEQAIEDSAHAAALEERNRVARELHDIIGHGVSLMVVHAGAAEAHLADPETARRSLQSVQEVGRQAVADLARLLGVLREEHGVNGLRPQPDLGDVASLVDAARVAGHDAELHASGDDDHVPATVGLTAYRVVQEALTNARKHAPGAPVRVETSIDRDAVHVVVTNGAPTEPTRLTATGGGHGLTGLEERVAMFGGRLAAGPDGDGYAVRAAIPFR